MGKYESLKYWAKVKARVLHRCHNCDATIRKGDVYYKEKVNFVNPAPASILGELCEGCGQKLGCNLPIREGEQR